MRRGAIRHMGLACAQVARPERSGVGSSRDSAAHHAAARRALAGQPRVRERRMRGAGEVGHEAVAQHCCGRVSQPARHAEARTFFAAACETDSACEARCGSAQLSGTPTRPHRSPVWTPLAGSQHRDGLARTHLGAANTEQEEHAPERRHGALSRPVQWRERRVSTSASRLPSGGGP